MSRIVMNDAHEDRIYAAIHETIMEVRIKVLRDEMKGLGAYLSSRNAVDEWLHDLVEPIHERVREELLRNVEVTND